MRFVVTGGAGFIGGNIVRLLLHNKHEVSIIDNFHTGKIENLSEFKNKIKIHEIDIRDKSHVRDIIKNSDGVFHQAALANVYESFSKEEEYYDVNVNGTENVFDASLEFRKKIVFASSSSVYGEVDKIPIKEDFPKNPIHPYGKTKLETEVLAKKFSERGLKVIGLRYFNVFGKGQNEAYAGVITKFLSRINQKHPPIIYGDGSQTRDFVFVRDVAKANLDAMNSNIDFGFYNIGSGKATSILELAEIMLNLSGLKMQLIFESPLQGDAMKSLADISLTKKELGWKHSYNLESWFKEEVFIN